MRVFVAIAVADTMKRDAARLHERAAGERRPAERALRWVDPRHLHLTLRFLGEIDDGTAARAVAAFAGTFDEPAFSYALDAPSWLPAAARPRVLVREVGDGRESVASLAREVGRRLSQGGVEVEPDSRPFRPHVTLARARPGEEGVLRAVPAAWWAGAVPWSGEPALIDRVTIFESRLTPAGPVYTALLEAPLGAMGR